MSRSSRSRKSPPHGSGEGIGIDFAGGPVTDPTENVASLVRASEESAKAIHIADNRYLDAQITNLKAITDFARESESKFQNFAREAEARFSFNLNAAETRRIDQLASTRQEFQNTIRDMLAESVRTTSSLVSTQLVQIQATFDTRVTKLEASQLTQAGRSSVVDPAIEATLTRITGRIESIKSANDDALARVVATLSTMQTGEGVIGGRAMGRSDSNARLLAVVMAVAAVAAPVVAILAMLAMHHP